VTSFETSLYDETGKRRPDFGLASLLGVHATADRVLGPLGHSYMRLQDSEELGDTFKDTTILPNTRYLVPVRAEATAHTPLWLIPPYPVYPPETSWTQIQKEDVPLAYFRAAGKGHVSYFPGDLAATYGATHLPDHGRLLQGAVRWARAGEPRASVAGAGLVDFTLYEQADGKHLVGFLVNLTNPAAWQPPLTEIIPVGPQVVTLHLGPGARCHRAQLLVAGQAAKFEQAGEVLTVTVPNLRDFEVVVLDLE
jgi:hypothetical protein